MSRTPMHLLCGAIAALSFAAPLFAATATMTPARDNTLYEDPLGGLSNGSGRHVYSGLTFTQQRRRALFQFDIAGALPGGSVVDAVRFTLRSDRGVGGAPVMTLHRMLANWGEGASNAGEPGGAGTFAAPGDATWTTPFFGTSALWATPGGDFTPVVSAARVVDSTGPFTWGSTAQLVADVQAWITAPSENFGWILLGDEVTLSSANRFFSREVDTLAYLPRLEVDYHTAASTPRPAPVALEFAPPQPNPGQGPLLLNFALPAAGRVVLDAFDTQGRRVATLLDDERGAGPQSLRWDGRGDAGVALAPGVYSLRLTAGGETVIRRALRLR